MKRKDITMLITIAVVAAIISFIVANMVFKKPVGRSAEVPVVPTISSDFPDVKNDPAYSLFLNKKALDPTQPVRIGNSNNNNPFNGQ